MYPVWNIVNKSFIQICSVLTSSPCPYLCLALHWWNPKHLWLEAMTICCLLATVYNIINLWQCLNSFWIHFGFFRNFQLFILIVHHNLITWQENSPNGFRDMFFQATRSVAQAYITIAGLSLLSVKLYLIIRLESKCFEISSPNF